MELQLSLPKVMQTLFVITIILLTSLVLGLSIGTIVYYKGYLDEGKIYKGVYFNDIDVSGLKQEDIRQLVKAATQKLLNKPVYLSFADQVWQIDPRELGVQVNADQIIRNSYAVGRQEVGVSGIIQAVSTALNTKRFTLKVSFDQKILQNRILSLAKEINIPPIDAKITRINDTIVVSQDRIGRKLEVAQTQRRITKALYLPNTEDRRAEIVVSSIQPRLSTSKAKSMHINVKIASYSTRFRQSVVGRSMNIKLGANLLNGTIIQPGESFSFNRVVGPRTVERGFKQAPEIVNSKLVPGIGGGICQVSSTLYNAIILSDIKPTERYTHSHPLTYVPLGYDSTVSYNSLDFKFRNTLKFPIAIFTKVVNGVITVDIYGEKKPETVIKIFASDKEILPFKTIKKIDKTKYKNYKFVEQNGINGYKLRLWKVKFSNGKELKREILSMVRYKPVNQIIVIGSKEIFNVPKGKFVQSKQKQKTNLIKGATNAGNSSATNSNVVKDEKPADQQDKTVNETTPEVETGSTVDSNQNNTQQAQDEEPVVNDSSQ